ncbi:TonB-dependent receptor [uncultured Polaribacter sp.]|uniref:TonB-dependent receptor n=1 Tax=uncultured Polaribacter sp. TaxID=174711 RepID=UPI00261A094D|nr:TonB-dependent receptor [uncultured Polaribacter sp.]
MKIIYIILLFSVLNTYSQTIISGTVNDKKGKPIPFANVYLKISFEGNTTNESGEFSFVTSSKGASTLVISNVGYETLEKKIIISGESMRLNLILKEGNTLSEVIIAVGTFEASDKKRATTLKPLQIVTNSAASGDVYGALQTLPGTTPILNETGLFVRGGEASETKTIIDGAVVTRPFFSDVPDIPSRGRFDPFLFTGILFSTGGYSAEYGQALSSVLILDTNDFPENDNYSFGIDMAGISGSYVKTWQDKTAFLASVSYSDLSTLFSIVPQNRKWITAPKGIAGSFGFRHVDNNLGIFKSYLQYQKGNIALKPDFFENLSSENIFENRNSNLFWNNSFYGYISGDWNLRALTAVSYDDNEDVFNENSETEHDLLVQGRITVSKKLNQTKIRIGTEWQYHKNDYLESKTYNSLRDNFIATYAESDIRLNKKVGMRIGVRYEYSSILKKYNLAPRISLGYKAGSYSNISVAYGKFYQTPNSEFLRLNKQLDFENATHLIANYQWKKKQQLFRIEAYYKKYDKLIKEDELSILDNSGKGYSKGIDVFWKDEKNIKNLSYWLSYSLLDSKRIYRDYPIETTPIFVATHTLNLVANYKITPLLRLGMTYTYSSGRPYYNPSNPIFLSDKTMDYNNLNFSTSYLTSIFKNFTVIYFSLRNPLQFSQVLGYQYSENGTQRSEIIPSTNWSFFAGVSISIKK